MDECSNWFTIPHIPIISDKIKNALKDLNTNMSYFSLNKLSHIIKEHKDIFPVPNTKNNTKDVIYKISCKDYDTSYVGQTVNN